MFKIIFSLVLLLATVSLAETVKKHSGCVLAQKGIFKVGYDSTQIKDVKYISIAKNGKNFREILVGSKVIINHLGNKVEGEILDYKPNKRVRGKPKTGVFIVQLHSKELTKIVNMDYIFNKGVLKANTTLDGVKIWFETAIDYSFCSSK